MSTSQLQGTIAGLSLLILLLITSLIQISQQRNWYRAEFNKVPRINRCPFELNRVSKFFLFILFTRIFQ